MQLTHSVEARHQQTQRIDPRQILASEIMAWTTAELEAAVERELAENPALETRDGDSMMHASGEPVGYGSMGAAPPVPGSTSSQRDDLQGTYSQQPTFSQGGDETDPLERVASHLSFRDQMRRQVGQVASGKIAKLVSYLIECVDDRGYLVADPGEVAERFRVSRADVELAIRALQNMDPPGIGARDLRECLVLQVEFLEQNGECHPLARRLLTQCWDDLTAHREERIASRLKSTVEQVRTAILFLQKALTPYPSGLARESWENRSGTSAAVRPDIVFQRGDAGFAVELARDYEAMLNVAPLWRRLADKPPAQSDDAMRRYVRDHVERAQAFMTGISRRGQTLRRIAVELVRYQQGFLDTGNRAFLRPLTRQHLAEALGLDESVISRAVADKWAQLPGGEIVPMDAFFGNAHAVREALANLVASENPAAPYSDEELADLLTAQGFPLARRTVAKYRGLEKILPARLRRRSPGRGVREKAI